MSHSFSHLLPRRSIIEMILATDKAKHFKYLSQFRTMLEAKRLANDPSSGDLLTNAKYVMGDGGNGPLNITKPLCLPAFPQTQRRREDAGYV